MAFAVSVITLFPDLFPGPLSASVIGRALENRLWSLDTTWLRDHGHHPHRQVDDPPYGGGAGMVLRPDTLAAAVDSIAADSRPRIVLTPRGQRLTQQKVVSLAGGDGLVLVCGRYEGVDQRVIDARQLEEISIGDFVLSGGEVAAMTLIEACVRLLPDVTGNPDSTIDESFTSGRLEYPHYTRPRRWEGRDVPSVLLGGNHGQIARWRARESPRVGGHKTVSDPVETPSDTSE